MNLRVNSCGYVDNSRSARIRQADTPLSYRGRRVIPGHPTARAANLRKRWKRIQRGQYLVRSERRYPRPVQLDLFANLDSDLDGPPFVYAATRYYPAYKCALVKIGWSSNPRRRSRDLWAPLLGMQPGGEQEERYIHRRLWDWFVIHEWFWPGQPVLDWIDQLPIKFPPPPGWPPPTLHLAA
jgi:hypothetical protein